jgi:hypothetical protein
MSKSLGQRISDSFNDNQSAVEVKEYSEKVYASWRDVSASLGRSALLVFLLITVFELLVYQRTSTVISIGTLTLVNSSVVQIALPAVIAFVLYDGYRLSVRWLRLQWAYRKLIEIVAPKQSDNDLDIFIAPSTPSLWGIGAMVWSAGMANAADRFMFYVNRTIMYVMMFAIPIAFECQAYYRLIQKFGYTSILLWISLVITTLFLACTAIYVLLVRYVTS